LDISSLDERAMAESHGARFMPVRRPSFLLVPLWQTALPGPRPPQLSTLEQLLVTLSLALAGSSDGKVVATSAGGGAKG
jgi:hypothetical protein